MIEKLVSICIPTYEMSGRGVSFLNFLMSTIKTQTYTNYEIVISDHSVNNDIENYCMRSGNDKIKYFRNPIGRGIMGANLNGCLESASGEYIKIICQDDAFYDDDTIKECVHMLQNNLWVAVGCTHFKENPKELYYYHNAVWTDDIYTGNNKIGSPSVIMFKKTDLRFDNSLSWMVDCDFYYRMFIKYGYPICIDKTMVMIREWDGSTTNTIANEHLRISEVEHVKRKIEKI